MRSVVEQQRKLPSPKLDVSEGLGQEHGDAAHARVALAAMGTRDIVGTRIERRSTARTENPIENLAHATNVHPIDDFCNDVSWLGRAQKYSDPSVRARRTHGGHRPIRARFSFNSWEHKT
jgi:hypothetical protein